MLPKQLIHCVQLINIVQQVPVLVFSALQVDIIKTINLWVIQQNALYAQQANIVLMGQSQVNALQVFGVKVDHQHQHLLQQQIQVFLAHQVIIVQKEQQVLLFAQMVNSVKTQVLVLRLTVPHVLQVVTV